MGCCGSDSKKSNNNSQDIASGINNADHDKIEVNSGSGGKAKNILVWGVVIALVAGLLIMMV